MKRITAGLFILCCASSTFAQNANQLDSNPALFTVLAGIDAAGFSLDADSTTNNPLRKRVRDAILARNPDSLLDLRKFVALHHKQNDPVGELNQYVSFALSLTGAPTFKFRIPDNEMPPDVAELRGLELILPVFWQEAGLADLWRQAQPEYDRAIDSFHKPVTETLLQTTYYLRNPTSGYMGRRFQVFIELIGPPNQIQTRNYKDDYFVVITPSPEMPIDQIRYAFLHYLLDPLALKYSEQLEKKRGMADYAQAAPALDDAYKNDFMLLTTTCLAKAVESRLVRGEENRAAIVNQALREGFVFTPAFAEGLVVYEKQPTAMRLYLPDLINQIDLYKEEKRLDKIDFVRTRASRTFKAAAKPEPELTGAEKTLMTAEDLYSARNLDAARATYLRVIQQTSQQGMHARAYYGLARVAALQKDPGLAEKLFLKTLDLGPDAQTKSWTYVYLGRLALASGDSNGAVKNFRAALDVEGASEKAKSAAQEALARTNK